MHTQGRAVAGAGLIAEQAFGFSGSLTEGGSAGSSHLGNAAALSSSLLVCLMVPWSLCLVFYFGAWSPLVPVKQSEAAAVPAGCMQSTNITSLHGRQT